VQPTPLGETFGSAGPDTQPGDVSTPQGHGPERFDWRVDLRENTYKYERLMEPGGLCRTQGGETQIRPSELL